MIESQERENADPLRLITRYDYDTFGNREGTETEDAAGTIRREWSRHWGPDAIVPTYFERADAFQSIRHSLTPSRITGEPVLIMKPLGVYTRRVYDSFGRLVREEQPDGGVLEVDRGRLLSPPIFAYEERTHTHPGSGAVLSPAERTFTDRLGRVVGRVRTLADGTPSYRSKAYDGLGRDVFTSVATTPAGQISSLDGWVTQFDQLGRPIAKRGPEDPSFGTQAANYRYDVERDPTGRIAHTVIERTTPRGYRDTERKNLLGQLASKTDFSGGTLVFEHFADGGLKRVTKHGEEWQWERDPYGWVHTFADPDAGVEHRNYNSWGQVTEVATADGNITTRTYDQLGRMWSEEQSASGRVSTWYWDGELVWRSEHNDRNESVVTYFEYDDLHRTTGTSTHVRGEVLEHHYLYDHTGRLHTHIYPEAKDGSLFATTFDYSNGTLAGVYDSITGDPYWLLGRVQNGGGQDLTGAQDAYGRTIRSALGNGIETTLNYTAWGTVQNIEAHGPLGPVHD
ncbi:MAG: RHS repeat domain-containing protein, partial [Myxococcota bacterium]